MAKSASVAIINFHGIGTPKRPFEPGEEPYWVTQDLFEAILDTIAKAPRERVRITFDDSNASDLAIALPRLAQRGLTAQFFVLSGKLGQSGYLAPADLGAMVEAGMTIGSHGQDHVNWAGLVGEALTTEIAGSRKAIEAVLGAPVTEAAIPFGVYNRRVMKKLRQSGYTAVYSSDGGWADSGAWFRPRTSVTNRTTPDDVGNLIANGIGLKRTLSRNARIFIKQRR